MPDVQWTYQLDYSHPHPNRIIHLPPQEPVADVATPDGDELYTRLDRDTPHCKKWRGHVGTFIADQMGWFGPKSKEAWHIDDFPAGYSLWMKRRADKINRHDLYLYGFGGKKKFSSPQEFAFHALWLYIPEYQATHKCPCVLHNPGEKQGDINTKWLGLPPRFKQGKRHAAPRGDSDDAGPPLEADDVIHGYKNRLFSFVTSHRKILHNLPAPNTAVSPERDSDLSSLRHFRVGDIVWVSIPRLSPTRQTDPDEFIAFWPAIVRRTDIKSRVLPGPGRSIAQHVTYTVLLLGTESNHVLEEGSLLSWNAYQLPKVVRSAMQRAVPDYNVTPDLVELRGFNPVPQPRPIELYSGERDGPQAKPIPRTYQNALPPLAVARQAALELSRYFWLTDPYEDTSTVPSRRKFQGAWWGPERIWMEDLVRLTLKREELEQRYGMHDLLDASPSAENRALLAQITGLMVHSETRQPVFFAILFEIEAAEDDEMDVDAGPGPSLSQPAGLSVPARALVRDGYPLPPPPANFRFRRITPPGVVVFLPMAIVAGRYDPLPMRSKEHIELLAHIVNDKNVANWQNGVSLGDSADRAFKRVLSITGLLEGSWAQGEPSKPAKREDAAKEALKQAKHHYYYERWMK